MPSELDVTDDLLARLQAQWFGAYDAEVPTTPAGGHAIVWPSPGTVTSDRIGYRPLNLTAEWRIVCAGYSRSQVMDVVAAVRNRLSGWQPYPESKSSGRVVEVPPAGPLLSDTAAGETRFSCTLTFRLSTTRS